MKYLIIFCCIIFSSLSQAKTDYCTPVRLDQSPDPAPFKHIPVVHQALGTCYAHAAAQLLDAYRFSHDPPKGDRNYKHHTFSLDLALQSKNNWLHRNITGWFYGAYKDIPDGGFTCNAFNAGVKRGFSCSKEKMLEKAGLLAGWPKNYTAQLQSNENLETYLYRIDQMFKAQKRIRQTDKYAPCSYCIQNQEYREILSIVKALKKDNDDKISFTANIVDQQCKKYRQPVNKKIRCITGSSYRSDKEYQCRNDIFSSYDKDECDNQPSDMEILHEHLATQPVAISYCSTVLLKGKNYKGLNFLGFGKKGCGEHASIVIGRKRVGNKCMLLIRNSWGTSCNPYSKDFECEHGNIWVDEKSLKNNLDGINFIEDK